MDSDRSDGDQHGEPAVRGGANTGVVQTVVEVEKGQGNIRGRALTAILERHLIELWKVISDGRIYVFHTSMPTELRQEDDITQPPAHTVLMQCVSTLWLRKWHEAKLGDLVDPTNFGPPESWRDGQAVSVESVQDVPLGHYNPHHETENWRFEMVRFRSGTGEHLLWQRVR